MPIVLKRKDGGVSIMQQLPQGIRRKADGKEFQVCDMLTVKQGRMNMHVLAKEPTPPEQLPPEVAAQSANIVKVGEVSARKAFGLLRMFEEPVPIFDVVWTPIHEQFKASIDVKEMEREIIPDYEVMFRDVADEIAAHTPKDDDGNLLESPYVDGAVLIVAAEDVPVDRIAWTAWTECLKF